MRKSINILIAEDDEEDRLLIKDAFRENHLTNRVDFVDNGEELIRYLLNQNPFQDVHEFPKPGIIILDLNLPKMDGREALRAIKANDNLKKIPIVILTTSKAEEDIIVTYNLGVNSFITKPVTFKGLVDIVKTLNKYWFEIVELPA